MVEPGPPGSSEELCALKDGWVIEMLPSGQVDLGRDRRPVGYDLDMDEALDQPGLFRLRH